MLAKRTFWECMMNQCDVLSILMLQVAKVLLMFLVPPVNFNVDEMC